MFGKKNKGKQPVSDALVLRDANAPPPSPSSKDERLKAAEIEAKRAEMEAEDIGEILPIRKPKHIAEGTASGLKLAAGGFVAGAVALVAMPVMGAREGAKNGNGTYKSAAKGAAKGAAIGMAKGVGSGVVLPVVGAVSGTAQISRGAVQTPFAVHGTIKGKQWDKESRTWKHYSLPEEIEAVTAAEEDWNKKLAERREVMCSLSFWLCSRLRLPPSAFRLCHCLRL